MCDFGDVFKLGNPVEASLFGIGDDEDNRSYDQRMEERINSISGDQLAHALATLRTQNRIYPDVMDLTRRAVTDYGDLYRQATERSRQDDLSAFQRYGPQYLQSLEEADPMMAELRRLAGGRATAGAASADRFLADAETELGYGSTLSPRQRRDVQQGVRSGQTSRGMGFGPNDVFEEALAGVLEGENLRQNRQQSYLGALGASMGAQGSLLNTLNTNQRVVGDPYLAITGRPAQPQGANVMAPNYGGFQEDFFGYGINKETQDRDYEAARKASRDALIGSIIQGVLGAGGKIGAAAI